MLNIKHMLKKKFTNKDANEELMLIEIEASKIKKEVVKDRKKLNVCLCIDKSGSMDMGIKNQYGNPLSVRNIFENTKRVSIEQSKRKLDLVKEAAIKALDEMKDGDYISVVSFDNTISVEVEATQLNSENRNNIKDKINNIRTCGATNIHDAWVKSVEEVSKNISDLYINRVILLTDGQINSGEKNIDTISTNVSKIANVSISTSTFGVGEDFNENLLQSIAESGNGNFYYIDSTNSLFSLFEEEFNGISNICATDVKLSVELNDAFIKQNLNLLLEENNKYKIADLRSEQKIPLLFNIDTSKIKQNLAGIIKINYKNNKGERETITQEIDINTIQSNEWENLEDNKEI